MAKVTFEEVAALIAQTLLLERGKITPDSHFTSDLEADSLSMVELVMAFEDYFHIEIPLNEDTAKIWEDTAKIRTVRDAIDYLNERLAS